MSGLSSSIEAPNESDPEPWRARLPVLAWLVGILLATVVFWKLRIIDAATEARVVIGNLDIHTEHYPMTKWGFDRLFSGEVPHWNPHQLAGLPFQAIPHVGLLYPGNLIYGVMETAAATELSFVAHLFLAGAGAFLLCRALGFSSLAGLMAAFTFMWSGWMIFYSNQASLISGMSWLPATILLVELTLRGYRAAAFGLVFAVAFQILNGATEFFVHNMYVAAGYTLLRLFGRARAGEWSLAFRQGLLLLGCVTFGVLLASPQLLPSIELANRSVRGAQELSFGQARFMGTIPPHQFVLQALTTSGIVTVGILPLAGLFLGVTTRRRDVWVFALILVLLSAFLVFGGEVFRLYYETPLGAMFRRPHKFLHVYAFGQALMAALAVMALEAWLPDRRGALLRQPALIVCLLALAGGAIVALRGGEEPPWALLALLGGLIAFLALPSPRLRVGVLVALLGLQSANLFFGVKQDLVRPAAQLAKLHGHDAVIRELAVLAAGRRVHIERDIHFLPGLMLKAGMLNDLLVLGDYAPLASMRAAQFFEAVSPPPAGVGHEPFAGAVRLRAGSDWRLLDLAGARFYVVRHRTPADVELARQAGLGPRHGVVLRRDGFPRIYERTTALPRAYFVEGARVVEGAEEALEAIRSDDFDPRREVVLEGATSATPSRTGEPAAVGVVEIVESGRESLVIDVRAPVPGYLVVNDAFHPGWEAHGPQGELPLHRANHLFRAVPVEAGETRIEMRYVPVRFRAGLAVSAGTALVLVLIALVPRRRLLPRPRQSATSR